MFGRKKDSGKGDEAENKDDNEMSKDSDSAVPAPGRPAMPTNFRPEISRPVRSDIPNVNRQADIPKIKGQQQAPDPKTLVVGREISLSGEITACDKLLVEGTIEASLQDCRLVEIAEHGTFKGSAKVQDAEIRGLFEGELTVSGRLLVHGTGIIRGTVAYGQLQVERGGRIIGQMEEIAAAGTAATAKSGNG